MNLTTEQAYFVNRRVRGFANMHAVQVFPLIHILQEAYLQGMSDAVEFASIGPCPPHAEIRKSEGDTRYWVECQKCGAVLREIPIPNNA